VEASALEGAAWLAEDAQDFAEAAALFAQSDALHRALGQGERLTGLLINAALEARATGNYARATALLEQSLAQHRALGNRQGIIIGGLGLSLSRLALVLAEQGEYARAMALYDECLALARELGDREGIGLALLGLSDIARDQGDAARVRHYGAECLLTFRDLSNQWAIGFTLNNLAQATYLEGDLVQAASLAGESAAIFRALQAGPSLAEVLVTVGRIRGAQGESDAARTSLVEALTLAWAEGPRLAAVAALEEIAVQAAHHGQAWRAVRLLGTVAMLRQTMGVPPRPADQPALDNALVMARTALGSTAFANAWATGQTLPVEQVVASALVGPEEAM
jgi:tetratricopeptide (TPR) repeat protein